ncbi:MAG: CPBP family intramembrane metalloprotease [Clostridia bacterium]|nr:CPBP family intramembrane metalloprotease [Clostridia bacterium]
MDHNDFEQRGGGEYSGGTYYSTPRWDDFTIMDEKRARGRFSRFFLAVFVYMLAANIIAIAAELIITFALPDKAEAIFAHKLYIWGLNVFAMYIIAFPIFYLIIRKMRSVTRTKSKLKASEFFILIAVAEALMMIGNLIGTYLNAVIGAFLGRDITNTTSELIENSPVWVIFVVAVIIGPIVEELIFRKLLMDKLGMYGDRVAIFVSAIAFGIFHGNLYQLFYATLLGLLLAYVYSKTSNILYPIGIHMILNFLGSIVPLPLVDYMERYLEIMEIIAVGGEYDQAEFSRLALIVGTYSFIQMAIAITGFVFLIKRRRRIFVSDRCEILIPKRRRAAVILGNTGVILFIILMAATMVLNIFVA